MFFVGFLLIAAPVVFVAFLALAADVVATKSRERKAADVEARVMLTDGTSDNAGELIRENRRQGSSVVPMMFQRVGPSCGPSTICPLQVSFFSASPSSSDSRRCCPIPAAARTRSLCLAEPGGVRLPWPRPRCERQGHRSGTMYP